MRLRVGAEAGGVGEGFEPEKYWEAQGKSSEWMWEHAGAELREYVSAARPRATDRAKMGCWKSYVLQEAEATGREAKVSWAVGEGVEVHSMQHDCVVLGRVGSDAADEGEREGMKSEMVGVREMEAERFVRSFPFQALLSTQRNHASKSKCSFLLHPQLGNWIC